LLTIALLLGVLHGLCGFSWSILGMNRRDAEDSEDCLAEQRH